jgi:hypothetical protein
MKPLQSLQDEFQNALMQDRPMADGLLGTRAVAQFDVYRVAYRARLRAALRDNFELLPLVMGDESFEALANAYIAAHPSQHYSLRWYGHGLGDFMAANPALVDHPALRDLARMEWALRQAFDAAPAPVLTSAELAAVPPAQWANLHLTLQPSVQLLVLDWAVGPIWQALKSDTDEMAAPEALAHPMLVWRRGMNTQWKTLTPSETAFVQGLLDQRSFGEVCEALAELLGEEQAAASALALLGELITSGVLCALPGPADQSDAA